MEKLQVSDKDSEEGAAGQGSGASGGGGESKRKQLRKMSSKRRSSKQGNFQNSPDSNDKCFNPFDVMVDWAVNIGGLT